VPSDDRSQLGLRDLKRERRRCRLFGLLFPQQIADRIAEAHAISSAALRFVQSFVGIAQQDFRREHSILAERNAE